MKGNLQLVPVYDDPNDGIVVAASALREWTEALITRVGTPTDIARDVAEVLLASDLRGIASHGPDSRRSACGPIWNGCARYGDIHNPSRKNRSSGPPGREDSGQLGDRTRRSAR